MAEAPSDPMPTYSQMPSAAVDSAGGGHILVHGGGSVFNSYGSKIPKKSVISYTARRIYDRSVYAETSIWS